jgi:hypothetical protein
MSRTPLVIALLVLAQGALADEKPASEPSKRTTASAEEPAPAPKPRASIRVLQDPYDLASFYRSGGSAPGGWAGLPKDPAYSIASFYRGEGGASPYGWSRFWTNGYSARRPAPFAPFRRTIGQNGDLFLMVPFLAPVGPLSGAFAGY